MEAFGIMGFFALGALGKIIMLEKLKESGGLKEKAESGKK